MHLGLQKRFELWLPITFQPLFLMWPLYPYRATDINKDIETHRYETRKFFKVFYYKFGTSPQSHTAPMDFRETTKKLNVSGPSLG
jgi:hypothetical protein